MMDRGSFNGPGGPHTRWAVPPAQGAAMPAGLMVRNRLETGFIKNEDSILSYTIGVRSLDGSGPQQRDVALDTPDAQRVRQANTPVDFILRNTGAAAETDPTLHPRDVTAYTTSDIYRLAVSVDGDGWSAQLLNALAAVEFGASQPVTVYVSRERDSAPSATVTLHATSESDLSATVTSTVQVSR
jgi:hypothetical protein